MEFSINYFAVFVAGIATMVVGFLWYGPVFGKIWIRLMGWTPEEIEQGKKQGMAKNYALAFLGALVTAYVLAHLIELTLVIDIMGALALSFWLWLGFIVTSHIATVLWEGKSWKLYGFNVLYYLVSFSVSAVILTLWQ